MIAEPWGWKAALLLALSLAGCPAPQTDLPPAESVEDAALAAPPPMSAGTLRALGPHRFVATSEVWGDKRGRVPSSKRQQHFVFQSLDNYHFTELRDDRLQYEVLRVGREQLGRFSGDSLYERQQADSSGASLLGRTHDFWTEAFSPFVAQAAFERLDDSTVDGRPCRVYALSLGAPQASADSALFGADYARRRLMISGTPLTLSGKVYVDTASGNRLLVELEGSYLPRVGGGAIAEGDTVSVRYEEHRQLGAGAEMPRLPGPELIRQR